MPRLRDLETRFWQGRLPYQASVSVGWRYVPPTSLYQNGNRTGDFINRMDDFGRFHTVDFLSISYVRPNTVACIRVILTSTRTGNSLKINRMKISKINRMTKKIIGTGDFFSRIKINRIKNQPYQNRPYGKLTV